MKALSYQPLSSMAERMIEISIFLHTENVPTSSRRMLNFSFAHMGLQETQYSWLHCRAVEEWDLLDQLIPIYKGGRF